MMTYVSFEFSERLWVFLLDLMFFQSGPLQWVAKLGVIN